MFIPHLPFLHVRGEEPRLGMAVAPVTGFLRVIMHVCVLGPVEETAWWKFSGRLDPSSGTAWVASGKSRKLIAPVSPSPTMGKMGIFYQGFCKNELASMVSWWHRTLCVNREHKNVASLRVPGVLRSFASLSCLLMARERHRLYWCPTQIHPSQGSIPILKTIKIEAQGRRGVTFLRT